MDKIAMYEALLEDHPLWNKEAASRAHAARLGKSIFNNPMASTMGRMPKSLEPKMREIAYGRVKRPKSYVDAARQYLREHPLAGLK